MGDRASMSVLGSSPDPASVDNSSGDRLRALAKTAFFAADLAVARSRGPRILIYHQVTHEPRLQMDVSPEMLKRHVEWLASSREVIGLEDAVRIIADGNVGAPVVLTFDDGYSGLYEHAFPILWERLIPFTLYITSSLVTDRPEGNHLSWDQVGEMLSTGLVTLGAHTHSHPDMRAVSEVEARDEIEKSNSIIEERTGVRPKHFSYPKGYWSETAEPAVREAYDTAVLGAGAPITPGSDLHRLTRVPIQRADGFVFFKQKVRRGMWLEEVVRSRLKGYRNPQPNRVGDS